MNWKSFLRKYSIRFSVYLLIAVLLITVSVLIRYSNISRYKYTDESWDHIEPYVPSTNLTYNVLFDQHSHTYHSDGILSVEQNIKWHIAMGFNACAITDHNNIKSAKDIAELAPQYANQIVIIQGMEWTTDRIHMNFLGISTWDLSIPALPTDQEILEAIDEVHSQGGVVVANHLPWSNRTGAIDLPTQEQLLSWGVDYIEIVNEGEFDQVSYDFSIASNNSIGMITGTDMHHPMDVYGWTAINVTEFSVEGILNQLRSRNTEIFYFPDGAEEQGSYSQNFGYIILRPFYDFGSIIISYYLGYGQFDIAAIMVFTTYFILFYVVLEGVIVGITKIEKRRKIKKIEDIENN